MTPLDSTRAYKITSNQVGAVYTSFTIESGGERRASERQKAPMGLVCTNPLAQEPRSGGYYPMPRRRFFR